MSEPTNEDIYEEELSAVRAERDAAESREAALRADVLALRKAAQDVVYEILLEEDKRMRGTMGQPQPMRPLLDVTKTLIAALAAAPAGRQAADDDDMPPPCTCGHRGAVHLPGAGKCVAITCECLRFTLVPPAADREEGEKP